eukprot:86962_1
MSEDKHIKSVRKWLENANLSLNSINLLIKNGYNSIDLFICCNNNDIERITNDYNIPRIDKLNLKLAIKQYENDNNNFKKRTLNECNDDHINSYNANEPPKKKLKLMIPLRRRNQHRMDKCMNNKPSNNNNIDILKKNTKNKEIRNEKMDEQI